MDTKTIKNNSHSYTTSYISANQIKIDSNYIHEKGGILNALSTASAQYIYKVIEKQNIKPKLFDKEKIKKLHRSIIHKNAHQDEYFAELIFRAILPSYLMDLEIKEHILTYKEDDVFAKISWPNSVVFGIGSEESGGAEALQIFDEHRSDGTRIKLSCSQMIAEEFFEKIPESIQIILDDVNMSDSGKGAHQYNLKNIMSRIHDTLFIVGYDENKNIITKYLTENWKRAIIDACLTAMIYAYENIVYNKFALNDELKINMEKITKKSLDYFLEKTFLKNIEAFDKIKGTFLYHFKIGNHDSIDNALWKDEDNNEISKQILVIHRICFALHKCWGEEISLFVMMHIWQTLFQQQILFKEIMDEIMNLPNDKILKTKFGSVKKIIIENPNIQPEQKTNDRRKRIFNKKSPLWIFDISFSVPDYYNVATAFKSLINNDYSGKGNNGFGLFLLHDKAINSKIINAGPTLPYAIWKMLSDEVCRTEPDRWFQLIGKDGNYADFILNRNKAHQDLLPSNKIDIEFIRNVIKNI